MTDYDEHLMRAANSPFVRRTNPGVWASIAHLGSRRTVAKGTLIYHQGETTNDFYYLKSGRVKIFADDPGGLERLITIFEPGNPFGEAAAFDGLPCYVCAMAMETSEVYVFNAQRFMEAMASNASLLQEIIHQLAHQQRILALQAESISFYKPSEHVALLLSHLSAAYGIAIPGTVGGRVQLHAPLED